MTQKLSLVLFLILALACNKDDDPKQITSINGSWIVRTPDTATLVRFLISQDADEEYIVESVTVNHNGSDYNSKPIDAAVMALSPTQIESITFVNNSLEIPFVVIRLLDISVNADYTEMHISNSSFNIDGVFREFPMIKATRN